MGEIVSIYAIFANAAEAERIGAAVVEEHLAACINILGECRSIYRWQGKIERATETPAILKTRTDKAESLIARIAELHSYDVPSIVAWRAEHGSDALRRWLEDEVR